MSGSCRNELSVLLLILLRNNSFPQLGHAAVLNIPCFSLYGLKMKDPGLHAGLSVTFADELWLRPCHALWDGAQL